MSKPLFCFQYFCLDHFWDNKTWGGVDKYFCSRQIDCVVSHDCVSPHHCFQWRGFQRNIHISLPGIGNAWPHRLNNDTRCKSKDGNGSQSMTHNQDRRHHALLRVQLIKMGLVAATFPLWVIVGEEARARWSKVNISSALRLRPNSLSVCVRCVSTFSKLCFTTDVSV